MSGAQPIEDLPPGAGLGRRHQTPSRPVNRPTFFLLGASKAGTTSLHYYLAQHPDILMSDPKEPPFFRLEYERGADWYWRTYFRRYAGQRAAGDGAPQNLHLPFVAPRIAATAPEARLIVLCRPPVDRAVSAWRHNVRLGIEPLPFPAAVEKNLRRLQQGDTLEADDSVRRYHGDRGSGGQRGTAARLRVLCGAGTLRRAHRALSRPVRRATACWSSSSMTSSPTPRPSRRGRWRSWACPGHPCVTPGPRTRPPAPRPRGSTP